MSNYQTLQEQFWAGNFGNDYINRNQSNHIIASNLSFFSKSLDKVNGIENCIEFGANIGMNLRALKILFPNYEQFAIEINKNAAKQLEEILPKENIFNQSIIEFDQAKQWDLSIIKTVLIHINPESLKAVYETLFKHTRKYLLIAEYYNPSPIEVNYRGHANVLFKRDFAGEFMDLYPKFILEDYGFNYHRDNKFPQDDINWFLLRKT